MGYYGATGHMERKNIPKTGIPSFLDGLNINLTCCDVGKRSRRVRLQIPYKVRSYYTFTYFVIELLESSGSPTNINVEDISIIFFAITTRKFNKKNRNQDTNYQTYKKVLTDIYVKIIKKNINKTNEYERVCIKW